MATDPFLPFFVCPAQGAECYVVRGRSLGGSVEVSLSRDTHERHRLGRDQYTPTETLALRRFDHLDSGAYMAYASALEDGGLAQASL